MSRSLYIPEGYKSALTLRETQHAIKYIKDIFQQALSFALTLDRVSAPLIVKKGSGINDDLNGVERKVDFDIKEIDAEAEVVQSLAKWKRMALYRYGYSAGEGIYTDMNALRPDDLKIRRMLPMPSECIDQQNAPSPLFWIRILYRHLLHAATHIIQPCTVIVNSLQGICCKKNASF